MASMDIFEDDAFSLVELTAALNDIEYQPQMLGAMNLFQERSVRTESVAIERKGGVLTLVPTTPRGAPLPQLVPNRANMRNFSGVRIAKGDRLNASEIAGIRAFGTESEMMQVQAETADRMVQIRNDIELTHENMRLGMLQGKLLDHDGTVLIDFYTAWGIPVPAVVTFNFATLTDGQLRVKLNQMVREMARASKGAFSPQTTINALCGDEFYDALVTAPEVRATYLGWSAAADLRTTGQPWDAFPFGPVNWINYRGTDDNAKIAVPSRDCLFFPENARDAFLRINTPGEFFDTINQPGQPSYALTIPDRDRNAWVDIEVYTYPLYVATRPEMLRRGRLA